jgi:hypothetical protein
MAGMEAPVLSLKEGTPDILIMADEIVRPEYLKSFDGRLREDVEGNVLAKEGI